ncbi:MAG: ATP-binding cassette domain-containing protein [Acidobacteria bacterium]|nr:ATP-binding cassette domain-containing protein [Acidobacteriota bacterium]
MISVSNVSMRYGSKVLFEEVTTAFHPGRRYGLTGPNGAGKSTFMKLLTGEIAPQRGAVTRPPKMGVLKQDHYAFDQVRVIDTVIMGNQRLWDALQERDVLYAKPDLTDADGMRLGDLEGVVGEEDGYTAESDAAILLQGLDIPEEMHDRPMAEIQSGQKVRVLLAQALFGHPQALLLDEPTNHLDLESIHWLREFLVRYDGTLIVISHDRHFLNSVCTHIADIDYHTIITYTGGYDDMVMAKTQIRSQVEGQNAQREKKIAQLNDFIARFSAGTRSSQVQSRRKEVERLQTTELARSNIQRPFIRFTMNRPSGRTALEFSNIAKSYSDQHVVTDFSAIVNRGDKIVIVGRNGVGKTTLLKALMSDAPDRPAAPADLDSGTMRWGHEASIGYFPQDHAGQIEKGMTAVEWLHQFDPQASRQDIHGLLGQMLFSGEEGLKPTHALSGGETARLLFCRIMLLKPNVLILDEPTNHLDLESINALNIALQKFEGTVLLVTHDQDLMEEVGTRVWHFDQGAIKDHKGRYEEYAAALA